MADLGTSENSIIDAGTNSLIVGKFTIAAPKILNFSIGALRRNLPSDLDNRRALVKAKFTP